MYGKNTLDKIYLTQKNYSPIPLPTKGKGRTLIPRQSFCSPKGETLHSFKDELLFPLKLKGELQFAPTDPCSLLSGPCSVTPAHCFMLKISCNTKKNRTFAPNYFYGGRLVLTASLSIK